MARLTVVQWSSFLPPAVPRSEERLGSCPWYRPMRPRSDQPRSVRRGLDHASAPLVADRSGPGRLGILAALVASDPPAADGLARGLVPVPAWLVIALGVFIVVAVVAYLTVRRLARRRR